MKLICVKLFMMRFLDLVELLNMQTLCVLSVCVMSASGHARAKDRPPAFARCFLFYSLVEPLHTLCMCVYMIS